MSTIVTQRVELPEGYSVVDRLGAGGYGEVWKATAPGGLEKAVKIVFGHCDESMAERELKSLERIKSVRHPFLLSIERYEIVNNRLVIVTELADMSLSDCFQNHLAAGRPGVPRDQLLAYLWDAADALDCLLEHHSLLHLDIKPENLLVVGEHIKVADFGLVKELASKTLNSVMGGMTPLYSAPEIYDNNPSPRSDQYSLAIVYQHMLTATLPFSGRTPAQLAKQHTLAQPNVNPLNDADRAIVRRALDKNPQARFASCREFVSALRSAGYAASAIIGSEHITASYAKPASPIASDDTKSISLSDTKHQRDPICIAATQKLAEFESAVDELANLDIGRQPNPAVLAEFPAVDERIVDVEAPEFDQTVLANPAPTLFVGIGGVGIKLLKALRTSAHGLQQDMALAWLAIDTERETLKATYGEEGLSCLSAEDKLHIPLRRPNQYREDSQALLQWVSRRWLYNIPRSLQTRGFRPLGRIAIVDHATEVLTALQRRLQWLAAHTQDADRSQSSIRVVVLGGMSGGTGGGTAIDVAQAVRSLCRDCSQDVIVHGVLGCTYHLESNDSLAAANMYALLTELAHAQNHGNNGSASPPGPASLYESSERPFDQIYIVPMSGRDGRSECEISLQSIANYLLLESGGAIAPAIDALRTASSARFGPDMMRTFSCINLGHLESHFSSQYQQELLTAMVESWLKPEAPINDSDGRFFQEYSKSHFARAVLAQLPEIADAPGDFTRDAEVANQRACRSAKIKCLANAFLRFMDTIGPRLGGDQKLLDNVDVTATGDRIIVELCQLLENACSENRLEELITELVDARLAANSAGPDKTDLIETALSHFNAGPLDCGFQRSEFLVVPHEQVDSELTQAFRNQSTTGRVLPAKVSETYLVRDGSGLNPLHLGARLMGLYPDIAEAAARLHTRNDLGWYDLRAASADLAAID